MLAAAEGNKKKGKVPPSQSTIFIFFAATDNGDASEFSSCITTSWISNLIFVFNKDVDMDRDRDVDMHPHDTSEEVEQEKKTIHPLTIP